MPCRCQFSWEALSRSFPRLFLPWDFGFVSPSSWYTTTMKSLWEESPAKNLSTVFSSLHFSHSSSSLLSCEVSVRLVLSHTNIPALIPLMLLSFMMISDHELNHRPIGLIRAKLTDSTVLRWRVVMSSTRHPYFGDHDQSSGHFWRTFAARLSCCAWKGRPHDLK